MSLNGSVPKPATYRLAAGRLGASALVFLAIAAATPVSIVTAGVPAAFAQGEPTFVPLVFVAAGLILLCFCTGYAAMARRAPTAGALWSFVARGLGRPAGAGAAWLALLSYNAIQIGLYGATGSAAAPLLESWFGITAPWWTVAAACWAVVAIGGLLRIEIVGALIAVVVLAGTAVIIGFAAANLLDPGGTRIVLDTLVPAGPEVDRPVLALLLVTAAFAFAGFEITAVYGEETRRPRRSITRATATVVALLTLLYAGSAWATSVAAGAGRVAGLSAGRGSELTFDLAAARLAPWAVTLGRALVLAGLVAAMISLHGTIARYTYSLGRERLLPAWLGRTTRRGSVPVAGSLTQSSVAAAALAGVYAAGWDPATQAYPWLTTAGALGVLVLLVAVSLAALLFLNRAPDRENAWQRLAPGVAAVLLGALAYLGFAGLPELLGVPADHLLVFAVPGAFAVAVLFGISYGYAMKAVAPVVYAGVGLGGAAVVVTPSVPRQRLPGRHRPERVSDRQAEARPHRTSRSRSA